MKKALFLLTIILLLFGCGKINKIDGEKFESVIIKHELEIKDVTEEYNTFETENYIEYAYDASKEDSFKIQFIKAKNEENMDVIFRVNKEELETNYNYGSYTSGTIHDVNSKRFKINNDDYYVYMRQVEDTLLYIIAKNDYKKEVNKIIKDLGY